MTVSQITGKMDRLVAIRDIQITQGEHVAKIEVTFSDEPLLHKVMHQKCEKQFRVQCDEESETYKSNQSLENLQKCVDKGQIRNRRHLSKMLLEATEEDKKRYILEECELEYPDTNVCPEAKKQINQCLKENIGEKYSFSQQKGRIVFTLISHADEIHQKVELPRMNYDLEGGREIFASWQPVFKKDSGYSTEFMTDANGLELVSRPVYRDNEDIAFSSSFYPVTSMISMSDYEKKTALTVYNDRP